MTRLEKIQRLNAIAADYEKGMSLPALAEKYGVCVRTCYRAIDKDAVKERTVALNKATKLNTEILNDYIANMSVTNIAAKNKTSTTHCYRVAKEAGLCSLEQGRNRRSSRLTERNKEIYAKRKAGASVKELAKEYQLKVPTVYCILEHIEWGGKP